MLQKKFMLPLTASNAQPVLLYLKRASCLRIRLLDDEFRPPAYGGFLT